MLESAQGDPGIAKAAIGGRYYLAYGTSALAAVINFASIQSVDSKYFKHKARPDRIACCLHAAYSGKARG